MSFLSSICSAISSGFSATKPEKTEEEKQFELYQQSIKHVDTTQKKGPTAEQQEAVIAARVKAAEQEMEQRFAGLEIEQTVQGNTRLNHSISHHKGE